MPAPYDQQRIVDALEDHLSRLDAAETYLNAAKTRVARWAMSSLESLVWTEGELRPVGELLREPMRNGYSGRAVRNGQPGIRTLTLTAVTRGEFVDAYTKVAEVDPARVSSLFLRPNDLLVQRSNTPELVGTSALYQGPEDWAIFPDLMIRLRAEEKLVEPAYLAAALRSETGHRLLRSRAKGLAGSMPKIDQGAIAATRIPVPGLERQRQVIDAAADVSLREKRLASELAIASARGRGLRRALLSAAFLGRLTGHPSDLDRAEELATDSVHVSA